MQPERCGIACFREAAVNKVFRVKAFFLTPLTGVFFSFKIPGEGLFLEFLYEKKYFLCSHYHDYC